MAKGEPSDTCGDVPDWEKLNSLISELTSSMKLCLDHRLLTPALVLLYSGMDIMASLLHPGTTTRDRFEKWVKEYMCPNDSLGCNETDLYGARCGLVHQYGAESSLSFAKKARKVFYTWGSKRAQDLQDTIARSTESGAVAINVGDLYNVFCAGTERFRVDVLRDAKKAEKVYGRLPKTLTTFGVGGIDAERK